MIISILNRLERREDEISENVNKDIKKLKKSV